MGEFKTFLLSYRHEGSAWSAQINAASFDDAERRLRSMAMNGKVDGQLIASIPANAFTHFPVSILLPIIVGVRNFFARLFRR